MIDPDEPAAEMTHTERATRSVRSAVEVVVCDNCRDVNGDRMDWPCETIQALDGAPEPEEVEWEYGVKWHDSPDPVWYHPYTVDEAEKKLASWPKDPGYVVRRRKPGTWLPVEGESR